MSLYSFRSALHVRCVRVLTPHMKPPPAPRMRNVPLPNVWPDLVAGQRAAPSRDAFSIDLGSDLDLEHLTRALGNHRISPHSTIHVLPTTRDRALLQITSGDMPTTSISFIRRLWSLIRASLSLQVYQSELSPEGQQAVCSYFLSRSGPNGTRLWQDFINGHHHPQGPKGEVLLQGHLLLWGFRRDGRCRWIVDVDVQRRIPNIPHANYNY